MGTVHIDMNITVNNCGSFPISENLNAEWQISDSSHYSNMNHQTANLKERFHVAEYASQRKMVQFEG